MIPDNKGFLILNGNIMHERDLIFKFADEIKELYQKENRKILLITASWGDRENSYGHILNAFSKIGIESKNINNLLVYGKMKNYLKMRPLIGSRHSKIRKQQRNIQSFYRMKNRRLVTLYRDLLEMFRMSFPNTKLSDIINYKKSIKDGEYDFLINEKTFQYLGMDIKSTLRQIRFQDNIFSRINSRLAKLFFDESSIMADEMYQSVRSELISQIESASNIFVFGGNISTLLDSISFFGLGREIGRQLERRAGIYTISAGSMIMCKNIIIYNDFNHLHSPFKSEFEFFSRGLDILKGIQIFPHCKDRIKMEDSDNLSYLAYRFSDQICTGLDQNSYLLAYNQEDKQRTMSYGEKEGAYIFDISGRKITKGFGEELLA